MKPQLNFSKFPDTPQWEEYLPGVQLQNLSHLIASKLQGVYLIPLIDLFCVSIFSSILNNLRAIFNFGLVTNLLSGNYASLGSSVLYTILWNQERTSI